MISKRQKQVLEFIKKYQTKYSYAPSLDEIRKRFRLASVSTAHFHISKLEGLGYLNKEENRPRGIDVNLGEPLVEVPLVGSIAAGHPIEAIVENESIAVPKSKLPKNGTLFALRVKGDSMADENIDDGDIVVAKSQSVAESGQRVVALIDNQDATLKKFYKEKDHIRLQPANQSYKPVIIDGDRLQVQGVVVDVVKSKKTEGPYLLPESEIHESNVRRSELKKYLNTIECIDCIEGMKKLPENSIDLTVTSPPYDELRDYNGYKFDFENIARGLYRITKKGGIVVWVVGDKVKNGNRSLTSFRQAIFFQDIGFNVHDIMIYKKRNTPFMRTNGYTNCYEFMFVFSKDKPRKFYPIKSKTVRQGFEMMPFNKGADGVNRKILKELKAEKTLTNIWEYAVGLHGTTSDKFAFQHPAVFPEKLAEDHILSWTDKGDVVYDPMCGSGTTCKVALQNSRYYIAHDISQEYIDIAKRRVQCNLPIQGI